MIEDFLKYAVLCLSISMTGSCGLNKIGVHDVNQVRSCQGQCNDSGLESGFQPNRPKPPKNAVKDDLDKHDEQNGSGSGVTKLNNLKKSGTEAALTSQNPDQMELENDPDSGSLGSSLGGNGGLEKPSGYIEKAEKQLANYVQEMAPPYGSLSAGIFNQDGLIAYSSVGFVDEELLVTPDQHTQYRIGSISKLFTSAGISMLIEQGLIQENHKLQVFYSQNQLGPDKGQLTLANLVTHTSGLPRVTGQFRSRDDEERSGIEELLARLRPLPLYMQSPPGSFLYSNLGYGILGDVISKVSGGSFHSFMTENIISPLNLMDTRFKKEETDQLAIGYSQRFPGGKAQAIKDPVDLNGMLSAGGLYSSVHDMSVFGASFLRNSSQTLLKTDSVNNLLHPRFILRQKADDQMGFGWFIYEHEGEKMSGHSGMISGYSSFILLSRDQNLGVILLQSFDSGNLADGAKRMLHHMILSKNK